MAAPHVIVLTSPQFFCGWAGVLAARWKRVPLVLEIRDIWPESITTVGPLRRGLVVRALESLERRMYRSADRIVAVGNGYRDNICGKVADAARKTSVITNGVDLGCFTPQEPDVRFLDRWDLHDKFVCSYIGTIGMAHGLDVVLEAARLLKERSRDDIHFCLIGDGARRAELEERAAEMGVEDRVVFTGRLPRDEMPVALASSDACLVHLKGCELFGTVIPSKIFETMAMQRPIIMGVRGEARHIVLDAGAGVAMEPECPESLVAAVEGLADDPEHCRALGANGRAYVAEHFDRDVLAGRYLQLLGEVTGMDAWPHRRQAVRHGERVGAR